MVCVWVTVPLIIFYTQNEYKLDLHLEDHLCILISTSPKRVPKTVLTVVAFFHNLLFKNDYIRDIHYAANILQMTGTFSEMLLLCFFSEA